MTRAEFIQFASIEAMLGDDEEGSPLDNAAILKFAVSLADTLETSGKAPWSAESTAATSMKPDAERAPKPSQADEWEALIAVEKAARGVDRSNPYERSALAWWTALAEALKRLDDLRARMAAGGS